MSAEARVLEPRPSYKDNIKAARKLRRAVGNYCRAMEEFYGLQGRFRVLIDESGPTPVVSGWQVPWVTIH